NVDVAFNFYPDSRDPYLEHICYITYKRMKEIGKPLLVTETNRDTFLLRRELACGTKLLGPYNQVAGTNFGFTNSVNNWGKRETPLSFITSDYNFRSLISPAGEYDAEALESRLFGGLLASLGVTLAAAEAQMEHGFAVTAEFTVPGQKFPALALKDGGWLLCTPNTTDTAGKASIKGNDINFESKVGGGRAPFFPIMVPLRRWGLEGRLEWASAEIAHVHAVQEDVHFLFYSEGEGQVCFHFPGAEALEEELLQDGVLLLSGSGATCTVKQNNRNIYISVLEREKAARLEADGSEWKLAVPTERKETPFCGKMEMCNNFDMWMGTRKDTCVASLETHGLWRGYGLYAFCTQPGNAILLKGAADILCVHNGDAFMGTRISAGQWQFFRGVSSGEWSIRTEIWGHSNFDDSRLDGMRLKSSKGISAAYEVLQDEDISGGWAFDYWEEDAAEALKKSLNGFEPMLTLNSWNTTRMPAKCLYRKTVAPGVDSNGWILWFDGNKALAKVYVNGKAVGDIKPLDPYLDISSCLVPGRTAEIAVAAIKKDWNEPVGTARLMHCRQITDCRLFLVSDTQIPEMLKATAKPAVFPVKPQPGEVMILAFDLDTCKQGCTYVHVAGKDLKYTAVFNDRVVGRIFLDGENKPWMIGGDPYRCYLPGPWFVEKGNILSLLIEATGMEPIIEGMTLEYI
ncbi:MAG: beta-galactosidase, partial [Bacteroidetes bacterium]